MNMVLSYIQNNFLEKLGYDSASDLKAEIDAGKELTQDQKDEVGAEAISKLLNELGYESVEELKNALSVDHEANMEFAANKAIEQLCTAFGYTMGGIGLLSILGGAALSFWTELFFGPLGEALLQYVYVFAGTFAATGFGLGIAGHNRLNRINRGRKYAASISDIFSPKANKKQVLRPILDTGLFIQRLIFFFSELLVTFGSILPRSSISFSSKIFCSNWITSS